MINQLTTAIDYNIEITVSQEQWSEASTRKALWEKLFLKIS